MPGINGLSWLAEEQTSSCPPLCTQSHAQPDPNLVEAAFEKSFFKRIK